MWKEGGFVPNFTILFSVGKMLQKLVADLMFYFPQPVVSSVSKGQEKLKKKKKVQFWNLKGIEL